MNFRTTTRWFRSQVKRAFPNATNVIVGAIVAVFWGYLLLTVYAVVQQPEHPYQPERSGSNSGITMNAKKQSPPNPKAKKVSPATPRAQGAAKSTPQPPRPSAAKPAQPKVTLYRHTTAPRFGDPQLDKIASDISHGIAKRGGTVTVSTAALTQAMQTSKNVKWRTATPVQWCEAVHSFLMRNLAHRTKSLTYKAEGSTIQFRAIWRMPTK
jgi:hypothetical protein